MAPRPLKRRDVSPQVAGRGGGLEAVRRRRLVGCLVGRGLPSLRYLPVLLLLLTPRGDPLGLMGPRHAHRRGPRPPLLGRVARSRDRHALGLPRRELPQLALPVSKVAPVSEAAALRRLPPQAELGLGVLGGTPETPPTAVVVLVMVTLMSPRFHPSGGGWCSLGRTVPSPTLRVCLHHQSFKIGRL